MPKKVTTKKVVTKVAAKAPRAKVAAEKSPKKVTAKKVTVPAVKGKKNTKFLVCAPDDKCFWTTDGQILKNLEELKLAFGTMDDEVFLHHANKHKNDFAEWVEHVLEDARCAADLRKAKKLATAKTVVIKHLGYYEL